MTPTLLLIDGEHYPPVIRDALPDLHDRGIDPVAALFLGGDEKTSGPPELPIPVHTGDPYTLLPELIDRTGAALVLDLSDQPVLDPRSRFALAGLALAAGASYRTGNARFDPPPRPRLTSLPTVAVVGTGKRTGKTAVTIELARYWRRQGRRPCIVTMGRGGPPHPTVLRADELDDPPVVMERLAAQGLHATSDYVEDALLAGVDTVGTRRLGAGPAGATVRDDFAAGVAAAEQLAPDLLLYEGSGTALPPAAADATLTVTNPGIDAEFLTGYLGTYRLALSHAVLVVGDLDGEGSRPGREVRRLFPQLPVLGAQLEPEPTVPVAGRRVVAVTTAVPSAASVIADRLAAQGAEQVTVLTSLGSRSRLAQELAAVEGADLVLTEIKAAAFDVVLPAARQAGAEVGFLHNRVVVEGGVAALAQLLWPAGSAAQESPPVLRRGEPPRRPSLAG